MVPFVARIATAHMQAVHQHTGYESQSLSSRDLPQNGSSSRMRQQRFTRKTVWLRGIANQKNRGCKSPHIPNHECSIDGRFSTDAIQLGGLLLCPPIAKNRAERVIHMNDIDTSRCQHICSRNKLNRVQRTSSSTVSVFLLFFCPPRFADAAVDAMGRTRRWPLTSLW